MNNESTLVFGKLNVTLESITPEKIVVKTHHKATVTFHRDTWKIQDGQIVPCKSRAKF